MSKGSRLATPWLDYSDRDGETYLELNYSEDKSKGSRLATPWLDYSNGDGEIYLELNYSEDESEGSRLATPWLNHPAEDGMTYLKTNFLIMAGGLILQGDVMSRSARKPAVANS